MLWGYSVAPDGHAISINCDHECLANPKAKCIEQCPVKPVPEKSKPIPAQYNIDRWYNQFLDNIGYKEF